MEQIIAKKVCVIINIILVLIKVHLKIRLCACGASAGFHHKHILKNFNTLYKLL